MAVNANGSTGTIDFISAAYESLPNTAITTTSTPVPEPSSLAALAAGGLAALRRRKRAPLAA